jgi:hypothetical protein
MLHRKIIAVYCDKHPKYALCVQNAEFLNIKVGGTYSYHFALKVTV